MHWSWCPCVAIMTSASSRTNTVIFLISNTLYLVHQSRILPGVPMMMCSPTCSPRPTKFNWHNHDKIELFWLILNVWCMCIVYFTFFTTDSKTNFDGTILRHFCSNFTSLYGQLICWWQTQHLWIVLRCIHTAQHSQDKSSSFASTWLALSYHVLRRISQKCW